MTAERPAAAASPRYWWTDHRWRKAGSSGPSRYRVSADETLDVGEDSGAPVNHDYDVPFRFTGQLHKVIVELKK